jgi:hypothetical protein
MCHSFLYARQNTGLLWHTAVRPYAPPPFVTIEGQLLSVRTVINMLHFLSQLIVNTLRKLAFSKLTKITPLTLCHSFLYARQNTGLLWHTAVRPSIHASYDNISHLFPLLLTGHVVTYIVLIKGGASERCDFKSYD